MQTFMRCSLKYISVALIAGVVGYFLPHQHNDIPLKPAVEVYKEVAHIPPEKYTNGTLIYTDPSSDTSYYIATGVLRDVHAGDTVSLDNGTELPVLDITLSGFYLDISDVYIHAGMSGSPIWYNNVIIGYISTMFSKERLYCIWST